MSAAIRKAVVIGAGVMGAGIAAHLANAGLDVVLLDLDAAVAAAGVARQVKIGGFMDPAFAQRVRTGSTTGDLPLLADADWIIEAVAERLDIKRALYAAIDGVRKPGSVVSSNTSTIPLAALVEGMRADLAGDFLITHFFNPPRRMRLFELVAGPATRPEVTARIRDFADIGLGKGVVMCKDTPGFIGNRIGNYWMVAAQVEAVALGLDVEEADAVIGKPFGIPATGVFGLYDLVGIDLMPTILRSLQNALPATDPIQAYPAEGDLIHALLAAGRTGRKGGGGFYRVSADRKTWEALDLTTREYRPQRAAVSDSLEAAGKDLRALMSHPGRGGRYAAVVMEKTLAYAAALVPEIADSPVAVDEAMRFGYGWQAGPFELIDRLGAGWLAERLTARGMAVPPLLADAAAHGGFYKVIDGRRTCRVPGGVDQPIAQAEGVLTLETLKLSTAPLEADAVSALWDLGDGVLCLEPRTKMNTFTLPLLAAVERAVARAQRDHRALVIGGDAPLFSAGADLRAFLASVDAGDWDGLGAFIDAGHRVFRAVKYATVPVVGAAAGLAIGGGCEILLHCAAVQAHAELSIGLVETKVGLIPGWGGCKEMLGRVGPARAFELIAGARTSSSAAEARSLGFLRPTDGITMNRDRLLADAKAVALRLADGYRPPRPGTLTLSGEAGAAALRAGQDEAALLPHDRVVTRALIGVLTGGDSAPAAAASEDAVCPLERAAFVDLLRTPATGDRIRHMLATGKPLRN